MEGVYVVKRPTDWAVISKGASRPFRVFDKQKEAIDCGRKIARNNGVELRIQRSDHKFRDADSHGKDPRNIPG